MLAYALLAGLLFGLYFTLVGLGLNLVFGVLRIVNLAHGDILMLGAFTAYWLFTTFRVPPLLSAALALPLFAGAGVPFYYLVVPRLLRSRDPEMLSLIFFFGLSQIIEALAAIVFGTSERSIPGSALARGPVALLHQTFPAAWVTSAALSGLAVLGVYLYLYRTRLGYLTRAVMVHWEESVASGIDAHRVSAIAFGAVLAPFMLGSVTPAMGVDTTITAFAVIVMGSLGSPLGTVLGGILYGVSLMVMQTYFSSWANLLPYLLLIGILLLRPSGLLGRQIRRA